MPLDVNRRACGLVRRMLADTDRLKIDSVECGGAVVIDFGADVPGGLAAGLLLARVCLADLADVRLVPAAADVPVPRIQVTTDSPVAACLLSQYAGWKIATDDYFAMGSGPMRVRAAKEDLIRELAASYVIDDGSAVVGILESSRRPTSSAVACIREAIGPDPDLMLLVAPTESIAGTVQVVARSVETALHRLHELKFPLDRITSATGTSPLPPVARDSLQGIGRTNDAILYGSVVHLWVTGDDSSIEAVGADVPSCASSSHGRTFEDLFTEADGDFYQLDPKLFSPAVVLFHSLQSGRTFEYGRTLPELLQVSFGFSDV